MAAARSSKSQWRAFLFTLVEEGDIDVLSPRDAMTQLTKQFGADVHGGDRVWIKQTLVEFTKTRLSDHWDSDARRARQYHLVIAQRGSRAGDGEAHPGAGG